MKKESVKDNQFGLASLIFGVLSLVFFFTTIPATALGILGIIFAVVQFKKGTTKWAIWGLVLSLIGSFLSIGLLFAIKELINQANTLVTSCLADPSLPGCDQILAQIPQ